ncbi:hypothetical protein D3P08_26325 [Paenibacillus nanensis]|uniref:Uncharacterized protein n=1 Tax=Paenibacillus nanensis TaxID=393251 RepID=A0A3A1UIW8_9BACL|nr:hypothetical protein [Paenibacillus nanensis]RIX46322.1 hypothetical protein D3P08_26325 [Paenibacillus nanensis]
MRQRGASDRCSGYFTIFEQLFRKGIFVSAMWNNELSGIAGISRRHAGFLHKPIQNINDADKAFLCPILLASMSKSFIIKEWCYIPIF